MKLVAISDIHGRALNLDRLSRKLEETGFKPDVVLVAGDITHFKDFQVARGLLRKIKESVGCRVLFVPGNCDSPELLEVEELDEGVINIHSRSAVINGYVFYGIGGGGISPFHTLIEFSEEAFRDFLERAEALVKGGELILVTHQPIRGFFDDVDGGIGSKVFAEYLKRLEPLVWVTGHVHENSGWARLNKTTVVHPGPLTHGLYASLEVSGSSVVHVSVKSISDQPSWSSS
ncbi:MAG: metallophosphoesterase [Desulfurococcaceae archaeon]